jgi:transcriptional regulator with XRE-family HTH domain
MSVPENGQPEVILTASQLVAYNLRRARELRGWTQTEAAERLGPLLGRKWSKALFSISERSFQGRRIRKFSVEELIAFSKVFGYPVSYFLRVPDGSARWMIATASGIPASEMLTWQELAVLFAGAEHMVPGDLAQQIMASRLIQPELEPQSTSEVADSSDADQTAPRTRKRFEAQRRGQLPRIGPLTASDSAQTNLPFRRPPTA